MKACLVVVTYMQERALPGHSDQAAEAVYSKKGNRLENVWLAHFKLFG